MLLHPMPGYVLVELGRKYENVSAETKVYEQANSGKVGSLGPNIESDGPLRVGNRIYWTELTAGAPITTDDGIYCFVPVRAIEGYEVA